MNDSCQYSHFSAGGVEEISEEARVSRDDLVSEACLISSKESLHQVGECAPRNTINKFDTGIPALEILFSLV